MLRRVLPKKILLFRGMPPPESVPSPLDVEAFLADETIGPLTGLAKLLADYRMLDEPNRPQFANVRDKLYAGILLCYKVIDEPELADRLVQSPNNPLTPEFELKLEDDLMQTTTQHRFETLLFHPEDLREKERALERDLRLAKRPVSDRYRKNASQEMLDNLAGRPQRIYDIQRQLLGVQLSEGRIRDAMRTLHDINTQIALGVPLDDHTAAIAHYLQSGGEKRLRLRGLNPARFYAKRVGSEHNQGRAYGFIQSCKMELAANIATWPVVFASGAAATYFANKYHIVDRIRQVAQQYIGN